MEFEEVIKKRRSVRKFLHIPVPRELIARIIGAGHEAPCAGNIINWRFVIVQDEQKRKDLAEAALEQHWIAEAPVVLVLCSRLNELKKFYGLRGEKLYSIQNCAAVAENMVLQAVNLGLASCWVSAFDENEVQRTLDIPDDIRPQVILPIGYPAETNPRPLRYKLEDITFFDSFKSNKMEWTAAFLRDYKFVEKVKESSSNFFSRLKSLFVK